MVNVRCGGCPVCSMSGVVNVLFHTRCGGCLVGWMSGVVDVIRPIQTQFRIAQIKHHSYFGQFSNLLNGIIVTPRQPNDIAELRQGGLLGCGDTGYHHTPSFLNCRQDDAHNHGDGDDLRCKNDLFSGPTAARTFTSTHDRSQPVV